MSKFYRGGFLLLALAGSALADHHLRVGHALGEAEASARLERVAAQIATSEDWAQRARRIRAGILRGAKLDRLPTPAPLKPIRHSRRAFDGYTVENVAFEALPGFFVTGNLYLPTEFTAPIPGVLAPHGHLQNKRRHESTQARCAGVARMGAAAFAWDMLGYGESQPFDHKSEQALRVQTYSSLRAVDYLLSLGIVDESRLAATGASGGGTQTFVLSAIDPRIDVSAPVVQVSAHFYGGCVCESGMPIHVHDGWETNNVEFAAAFAPKPLLLVSNGEDWTKNTPRVEYPFVRRIYALFDAEANVENAHFANEGHDYGPSKRAAVHRFFAKHLELDPTRVFNASGDLDEGFVTFLPPDELAVFEPNQPRPSHAVTRIEDVVRMLDAVDK